MPSRSEQIRQLAAVVNTMRPEWDTGGIRQILEDDSRPMPELIAVAMAVANDMTARTPAVIRSKETPVPGIDGRPPSNPQPPSVTDVLSSADRQPDDVAIAGAKLVREAVAAHHAECADNRAAVLAYPDLAELLTKPPLRYARPEQWNGYVPPRTGPWGPLGATVVNTSIRRIALVALVNEARHRKETDAW